MKVRYTDNRDEITGSLAAGYGYTVVPSADDPSVMAGAGTVVAAKDINPSITVIGVEPRKGADTAASPRAGRLVTLPAVPDTIADGLRHTTPAPLPWEVNKVLLDEVITVTDESIVQAMRQAFEYLKIVAEPSGAVALAALTTTGLPPGPAGVVVSGGSVSYGTFGALMAGLPAAGDHAVG